MDKKKILTVLALLAMASVSAIVLAQTPGGAQATDPQGAVAQADLPTRAGRIAYIEGDVKIESPAPDGAQADGSVAITVAPALLNWPVSARQVIVTGADGRAEVRIGPATLRLAANSALEVDALDESRIALMLHHGSAIVRAATADVARAIAFETPDGRLTLSGAGTVRIDVPDNVERTSIRVWQGAALFDTGRERLPVRTGAMLDIDARGGALASTARPDGFDDWSANRDRDERTGRTLRYVSLDVTGYEELDRYGDWKDSSPYGPLWTPRTVATGWAPFRDGRWTWVSPWGWTWIDQAPWGYATSHYGRWVWYGSRWSWAPGALSVRPVWAPALVSWVSPSGGGYTVVDAPGRFAMGVEFGWYPLGPLDPYVPPFWVSFERLHRYNAGHLPHFDARRPGLHRGVYHGRPNAVTSLPPVQNVRDWRDNGPRHSQPVFMPTPVRVARPDGDGRGQHRTDARPGDARGNRWTRRHGGGVPTPIVSVPPVAPAAGAANAGADIQRRREREEELRRDAARQAEPQPAGRVAQQLRADEEERERRLRGDRRQRDTGTDQPRRNIEDADQRLRGDLRRQQEAAQAQWQMQAEQRQRDARAEAERQRGAADQQRQREAQAESERQRNAAAQRQREEQADAERQRDAALQRQQADQQRQRDAQAEAERQRNAAAQQQRQREAQAQADAERQRGAAAEQQRQRDAQARAEAQQEETKTAWRQRESREAAARVAADQQRQQEAARATAERERGEQQRQQEAARAERQRATPAPAPAPVAAAPQPAPAVRQKDRNNQADRDNNRDDPR